MGLQWEVLQVARSRGLCEAPLVLRNEQGSAELERPIDKMWLIKLSPLEAGAWTG